MQIKLLESLAETPIQIIWRPVVATVVPDTFFQRPPMEHSCSNPSGAASPTATLDNILMEESFFGAPLFSLV